MNYILLAGQSNMAGRGNVEDVEKIYDSRIFMLKYNNPEFMEEPVHTDSKTAGIGPAPLFALEYIKEYDEPVGLIPCAHGGTKIIQWQPGGELFENMIHKASLLGQDDEIVCILWAQGESDARNTECVEEYIELFDKMLDEMDSRLGTKNVPFIMADIPPFYYENPTYPKTEIISQAIKKIASRSERFGFVKTHGLTSQEDGLHYDSKSYRVLGKRFFDEYKRINKKIN